MIVMRLSGGLGNQMFQYSLGRSLSIKNNTDLYLDIDELAKKESSRKYELGVFDIKAKTANNDTYKLLGIPNPNRRSPISIFRKQFLISRQKTKPISERKFIIESGFLFEADINKSVNNSYLSGIWQSEKYFTDHADIIRQDFTLNQWSKLALAFKKQISDKIGGVPVSIHIRRGDYMTDVKTNSKHGLLTLEYYRKAVGQIRSQVTNPVFYVFSDDIEWCKSNLDFISPIVFVSDPKLSSAEELLLMSTCDHNIIANSTFSWWGAWLNTNQNKTVITPANWFKTETDTKDLIPDNWIRL